MTLLWRPASVGVTDVWTCDTTATAGGGISPTAVRQPWPEYVITAPRLLTAAEVVLVLFGLSFRTNPNISRRLPPRFVLWSPQVVFVAPFTHPGMRDSAGRPRKQTSPRLAAGHRLGNCESRRSFFFFFFQVCLCEGLQRWNRGTRELHNAAG